jgi:hypothetical protein
MSDIINKLTGTIFRQVDNTLCAVLVDAGIVEYYRTAQVGIKPRSTVPTFAVVLQTERNKYEIVCTLPNGGVHRFDGSPHRAKDAFKAMCWSADAQAQILQGPEPSDPCSRNMRARMGCPPPR